MHLLRRTFTALIASAAVVAGAGVALAQPAGNIDLNVFRPAMDSRGYLTINASQVLGHGEVSFGLGALDWGYKMLSFKQGLNEYSIDNVVAATLVAAYGLKLGPVELEVGASVPFVIMAGDRGPDAVTPGQPNNVMRFKLDGQGLGNVGLHLKTRFLKANQGPKIGVGVIGSVYLPTVSQEDRFLGETKVMPQVIGIIDKEFGRKKELRVALNGGIRLRSAVSYTDNGDGGAPATNQTISTGAEIPFGLGVAYAIAPQKFDVVAELFGTLPLDDAENYAPLEAIGGAKLYLARNSFLSLGAGRGLRPSKGANPDFRAFIGIVFEPNIGDRDGDGIKDDVDECPDSAEDIDGFQDEDGCPDCDDDGDGVLECPEALDKCPGEKGEPTDGCAKKYNLVVITENKIELKQTVFFDTRKATIKKVSFPLLNEVAQALADHPTLQVRIEGHTDSQGADKANLKLSQNRAASVRKYLIGKGVDGTRMVSEGFGERVPIADNRTSGGRAQNRRVEFVITSR